MITKNDNCKIGDKVIVIEHTNTDEIFEWEAEITQVTEAFIETAHRRNPMNHPQWIQYIKAYEKTWVKHYFHPDNILKNIKKIK